MRKILTITLPMLFIVSCENFMSSNYMSDDALIEAIQNDPYKVEVAFSSMPQKSQGVIVNNYFDHYAYSAELSTDHGYQVTMGDEYLDYGDIRDRVNGRDVSVEFFSAEESGASFPKTNIRVKPNQTPISDEPSVLELVKTSQKDITEIYQEQSYDDLTNVLNEWLNPSEDSTEEEEVKQETTSTSDLATSKVKDTSEAFDELFNS